MIDTASLSRFTQDDYNQIVSAHERYVGGQRGGRRAIVRFGQARGVNFSHRRLEDSDFTGTNLQGADLVRACFDRASLHFADMRSVNALGASFVAADMRGVSLRNAVLTGANLDDADLSEAVLAVRVAGGSYDLAPKGVSGEAGGVAMTVDFTGCTMKQSRLAGANLQKANFSGALLNGADLTGAELAGARMDGAVLTGANLERAYIDPAALAKCVLDPTDAAIRKVPMLLERLEAAELWVQSSGAEGRMAVLDGEDVRPMGAALQGRPLTALSARNACAIGVSFVGAQLQAARFDGADLRDADFSGADLRGASFRGANLNHALFDGANLRGLPLGPDRQAPVDLAGAKYGMTAFAKAIV
jgi:uncharacterized protein YjbI with pentapeptide repeats